MYFKTALLALALTVPVVLAKVPHGIYRITNAQSGTTVRAYQAENPLFVSNTLEFPGPFELWDVEDGPDGAQTIKGLGLDGFVVALPEKEGTPVVVTHKKIMPTLWAISPAGTSDGKTLYTIQANNQDLLWNAEPPVVPHGSIFVRGANGKPAERYILECVNCNLEDKEGMTNEYDAEKFEHLLGQVLSQVGHVLLEN